MVSRLTRETDHVSLLLGGVFEGVNCLIYRE
jgi:hypothetical protein